MRGSASSPCVTSFTFGTSISTTQSNSLVSISFRIFPRLMVLLLMMQRMQNVLWGLDALFPSTTQVCVEDKDLRPKPDNCISLSVDASPNRGTIRETYSTHAMRPAENFPTTGTSLSCSSRAFWIEKVARKLVIAIQSAASARYRPTLTSNIEEQRLGINDHHIRRSQPKPKDIVSPDRLWFMSIIWNEVRTTSSSKLKNICSCVPNLLYPFWSIDVIDLGSHTTALIIQLGLRKNHAHEAANQIATGVVHEPDI